MKLDPDQILTLEEAAAIIDRSASNLRYNALYHDFPAFKSNDNIWLVRYDDLLRWEKEKGQSHRQTLCWNCQNALGGCSWSRDFIPVDGWEAEKTIIIQADKKQESYHVISCPLFREEHKP